MHAKAIGVVALALAACGSGGGGSGPPSGGTPGGGGGGSTANPVVVENQQPGGKGWNLRKRVPPGVLEAYASATSVQHGEALDVKVRSDTSSNVKWEAWRMGWYGGAGGRLLASGGPVPVGPQPTPEPDPATGRIACTWPTTFTIQTGRDWTSGVFMIALTRDDGSQTYVPFVVRADERKGVGVFQASFTTYQAYNAWGGKSLYDGSPPAVEVSFDRPFLEGNGAGQYFRYEDPFVKWAESRGYDLVYVTNVDVDRDPGLLSGQKLFLSVGHDEYWSRREREGVEAALAAGTSLAFFSANTSFWQIRLEPSRDDGRPGRTQVCWKNRSAAEDPMRGTPLQTTLWRNPPVNQPENGLLGVMFTTWWRGDPVAWVVQNASAWPYEGTGVKDGDRIPGIVGYETDRTFANAASPPGLTVLAHSPVTSIEGVPDFHEAVVRDVPGGAFVFATGTIEWSWGLGKDGPVDARVARITDNVLGRAGLHPTEAPSP